MSVQSYLQQHYSASSCRGYAREIERYLGACPDAHKAGYREVLGYMGVLRERYSNKGTIGRIFSCIKAYYNYLCDAGIRKDNPAREIRLMHRRSTAVQLQDLLSVQELEELMHRKRRYKHQDLRHEVLMGLLIYQALLPQELAGLQTDDIDLMNGTVYVRGSAKTNSRKLALKPKQVMLLHGYLTDTRVRLLGAGTTTCLLISSQGRNMTAVAIAQEVLRSHRDAKGVKRVNARTIRQSVIANLLKQGHDISVVQLFAGHKLPDATQRYQSDKVESLRAALHKYHPFNHDQGAADNLKGGG